MKQILESECKVAIKWFHENKMIVNLRKLQAIVLGKSKLNKNDVIFVISLKEIQAVP